MPQENTTKQLIINKLSKEQYNELSSNSQLSNSELYVITDDNHYTEQEITTLLSTKQGLLTVGQGILIDENDIISLDLENVYLREEVDILLSSKSDLNVTGNSLEYDNNILTLKNVYGDVISSVTIKSLLQTDNITVSYNTEDKLQSIGEITKNNTPKYTWIGTQEEYNTAFEDGIIDEYTECLITDSEAESVTPIVQFEAPTKLSDLANDIDFATNALVQEVKLELENKIDTGIDDTNLVHKTGTEIINGFKTFTEEITIQNGETKGRISHKNTTSETPSITDGYIEFGENTLKYGKESEQGLLYHTSNDIFHSGNLVAGDNIQISNKNGVYTIDGQAGGGTGGTTVYVDEETIVKNDEEVITAVGVKSKNDTILYDWVGTLEEYNAGVADGTIQPNWICWIINDEELNASIPTYGSDVALLDIIVTNQALEGVDKIGKELQGSLVLKSEYPDAYKKLLNQKNKATSVTETINGIEVTYYQCTNGWKVMSIDNKSIYDELFENTGSANFFVLDETSENFYLPKTNNLLQPNVNVGELGRYNEAGLPNITGTIFSSRLRSNTNEQKTGAFSNSGSITKANTANNDGADTNSYSIDFDASLSNPIYGNSDTVQPQSVNVFIYYKVGNTLQESATIDMEAQILELKEKVNRVFGLFDTKISDHILEGDEAKGWALQGTYVTKALYPDFYNKCLEEKNAGVENETTLSNSSFTMYINSNGHQFFNITDKSIIDEFYNTYGIADFYGVDEENERIFLPRNKYFFQLTDDVSKVNEMVEAGLPNIEGKIGNIQLYGERINTGAFDFEYAGGNNANSGNSGNVNFILDASLSNPIYGNSNTVQPPSSLKLLYYCVGNTEVKNAITNITELTTSENDTIPLFTGMYFDFKPNNPSWLKAGEQQNNAGIYKTCYETLVEIVNGINNYDLKVINQADMISGVVYDEYWVLDQDNLTFRTPLTIATKSLSGGVIGNGMTLGLTDGTNYLGTVSSYGNNQQGILDTIIRGTVNSYGSSVGNSDTSQSTFINKTLGITTDPSKSGIIAEQSNAQLYFKVANAVQNLELLDAGEVLESLTSKLDRGNKEEIVSWCMPDYSAGISGAVTGGTEQTFTAPANGIISYSISAHNINPASYIKINDVEILSSTAYTSPDFNSLTGTAIVAKGDVIKYFSSYNGTAYNTQNIIFFPMKGAN